MNKWYFTFGLSQYKLARRYVVITSDNYEDARSKMHKMFGTSWCTDYDEDHWFIHKGTKEWNLYVGSGHIPADYDKDIISQAEIFHMRELVLD